MGKNYIFQQIEPFEEFLKKPTSQTAQIAEANEVAIDVPFWDEALSPDGPIFNDIYLIAGRQINWDILVKYIKIKYSVIDRKDIVGPEALVIAHLRDLLFSHYGDTIIGGDIGYLTYDNAEMGAKSLVISQLATELLKRIRIEAGLDKEEPEKNPEPAAKVSLNYGGDDFDDFLENNRRVSSYEHFSKRIDESITKIKFEHDEEGTVSKSVSSSGLATL